VRAFDIDGFRVDAAGGPRERASEFWPRWRAELKRIKPDLLLLAEASARDHYYVGHGFDAAYDWTEKLGQWAWQDSFANPAHTAARLRGAITASQSDAPVFRFLNNNDTGARFLSRYGLGRARVAAAMLLTLPGLPGLYAGDEVGAAYEPYRDPQPIGWDDPNDLRSWYAKLIALRHGYAALRSQIICFVDLSAGDEILAYLRGAADPAENILVVLNYGTSAQSILLPDSVLQAIAPGGRSIDLVNQTEVALTRDSAVLSVAADGVRILQTKPN